MISEIKIPTLLGLGFLVIGLALGVFFVTRNQLLIFKTQAAPEAVPEKITVANLSANSVSIFWQTKEAVTGFIQAGTSNSLGLTFRDDRDTGVPKPHILHFVNLTNLQPDTTYYYKINSESNIYPNNTPLTFKTAPSSGSSFFQPIIGTIINTSLQPVDEAFVIIDAGQNKLLATVTKIAGNFILPLTLLPNPQTPDFTADLIIFDAVKSSRVTLKLPAAKSLPPIVLGQDLDLTASYNPSPSPTPAFVYDVNGDGVVNSLDLSTVYKNSGKNFKNPKADINQDGVVDDKDVKLLIPFIPGYSQK